MRILLVGDVVGAVGRKMVFENVPTIKKEQSIDLVICNGENAAHGKGITKKIYHQLLNNGVDIITMGNHTFSKKNLEEVIDEMDKMVRPANMFPLEFGKGYRIFEYCNKKIAVINLVGETFMVNVSQSAFSKMEEILKEIEADIIIVDLHAEATSEKIAFTYEYANRCSIIVGTHTHVQTADERIVADHCAAITDLGMCGPYYSVIGRDIDEVLRRFKNQENTRFTIAEGKGIFCGCIVEIDDKTNQAISISRIQIKED
ncbi:MAG: TIGR00282 family metallophosphoesterase [Traorella sp.]